jgi:ubiquinone/menaquinone biosynthesis C-methylase UbiE
MKKTTERLSPDRARTVEESVIDAMHRFAYLMVEEYAEPSDRLLEIGFGEGYGSEIVAPWVGEYVGVEVEPAAVTHAAEKYERLNTSFVHYDGTTLPFGDASFDLVIAFQVIEHVPDPEGFLHEARRVTPPGACVLIVTPNRNHRLQDGERPWNRYHLREYTAGELEAVMRKVFETVEMFGISGSPAMNEIEKRRVARARRLARLDRLGLRYVLPEGFDTRLRTFLRRRSSASEASDLAGLPIGVEHVHRARDQLETSIDLLAVGLTS